MGEITRSLGGLALVAATSKGAWTSQRVRAGPAALFLVLAGRFTYSRPLVAASRVAPGEKSPATAASGGTTVRDAPPPEG